MTYEITQIGIALFAIFLSASTWYLTGDPIPVFVGGIIAALILISYIYYYKLGQFKLSFNINPEEGKGKLSKKGRAKV